MSVKQYDSQEKRLDFLVKELRRDSRRYGNIDIPEDEKEKRRLMRSLMNLRMPEPISEEFLQVQDQFLQQEAREKGIVSVSRLLTVKEAFGCDMDGAERMMLWQGDITSLAADAIVNAANSQLLGCFVPCHGCIDNAIHSAAGVQLREACGRIMKKQGYEEPVGRAKITDAYNLPSKYVIHTVGPIIRGPLTDRDCRLLADCYKSCLELAAGQKIESIAFCCISTGEFCFPPRRAAEIAVETVRHFLSENAGPEKVIFNVFKDEDYGIYREIFSGTDRS
ncbi:protein-ADP-ribose hydrolase [Anaerovorax odorimutans]|uniref:Protein-ADP-ribose hydrolase n=1 Tax=Anaerovorax odorimutans TaxID=109327 RepID=A0ABT1RSG9_9FIRM|nr:protein-ADP-ribose hydrolase [Anaerovorax odorimutans]MCQ4637811.1 protein-ADP-ribose hydrolase [Anaerovorax odorimutans]